MAQETTHKIKEALPSPTLLIERRQARARSKLGPDDRKLVAKMIGALVPRSQMAREAGLPPKMIARASLLVGKLSILEYMDAMGVNYEFIINALVADIYSKKGNRLGELRFLGEIAGLIGKQVNLNGNINVQNSINLIKNIIESDDDTYDIESSGAGDFISGAAEVEDDSTF